MSKNKLIPELRFPEFQNQGEWEKDSIDNQFDLQDGYPFSSFDFTKDTKDSKQVIRITDINNQNSNEEKVYLPNSKIKDLEISKYEVHSGDLLLSLTGAAGFNFFIWNTYSGFINQRTMKISPKKQDNEALKFLLEPLIHSKINSIGTGQNNNLSKDALKEIEFPYPKPKEQRKLSSFITNFNDLIAAHSQKLDLLKDHKKGLMQNLFPQEGEKVPKVRFKEFEKDGEWVERTLIDTANKKIKWSFTGGPFGSNLMASDYSANGFRIIQLQNIGDGVFNDDNKIYASMVKADELLSCNIYAGDIIISKMGDPVGRACIIPDNLHRCIMASDGIRLVVDETKYSKYFIYSLINSKRIREAIEKRATGSTRKRIGLDTLREIELIVPKSQQEQQKIASCLSSLDSLITAQAEKIEQLKLHKKGLMQGLFPKIIEN